MKLYYPDAERGLQFRNGVGCCDVEKTIFYIETKKGKRTNIKAAMRQALRDGKDDKRPKVVVTRDDNQDILVTMEWKTFEIFVAISTLCKSFEEV